MNKIKDRDSAKKKGDYKLADKIRDDLSKEGIELKDEKGNVPKNVTNALFVGSTTELQKLIKKNKDKK